LVFISEDVCKNKKEISVSVLRESLTFREFRSGDPGEKVLKPRKYQKEIEFLQNYRQNTQRAASVSDAE
jgi:hypothetical protein